MAILDEIKDPIVAAIEQLYVDRNNNQKKGDDEFVRCSAIGDECERLLWYNYHWVTPLEKFDGRMLALFETGNLEEDRMANELRGIGVNIETIDPTTGEQFRVSFLNGIVRGSTDGEGDKVPTAPKTKHLFEFKTHNDKSFKALVKDGVKKSKPKHYAQMQIYMHGRGLTRALYVAKNKNDDAKYTERVKYDPLFAEQLVAKARRIAFNVRPPSRISELPTKPPCLWCKKREVCHENEMPRINCRTCMRSELMETGVWRCERDGADLSYAEQQAGCPAHLFNPHIVPGDQIDADMDAQTVTYDMHDGTKYVDGYDRKRGTRA